MSIDKKMAELEKIAKELEASTSFDKSTELFTRSANLVKEILTQTADTKGKVYEIIKDVDGMVEAELKLDGEE
ncbi:MAG: hypothetical protein FWE45_02155 [Firmicutes bacterium]|nr:hypothetical protein [Bacillota bacterium]